MPELIDIGWSNGAYMHLFNAGAKKGPKNRALEAALKKGEFLATP
jgi:hypothetical protein